MKSPIYNLSCLTKLFVCWFLLFSKTIVFIEVFGSAGGLIYRALSAVEGGRLDADICGGEG